MSEPYLGEIRMFSFSFAPRNWALCNGELLAIEQNQSLFSILGTTYGGDGRTTFALPDLRGRVPIGFSSSYSQGTKDGEESITLTTANMSSHTHTMQASSDDPATGSDGVDPTGRLLASVGSSSLYADASNLISMNAITVGSAGNTSDVNNMQPYLTISFCIALVGTFPPRN